MKHLPTIAGGLLGLLFVVFGADFFLHFMPAQPMPPEGSPPANFMGAMFGTGYLGLVKALEVLGGLLVAIPRTRNLGLLILGPIIVNIWAVQVFLFNGAMLGKAAPVMALITLAPLYLLWTERAHWCGLLCRSGK